MLPGKFTVKADVTYDGIRQIKRKEVIICPQLYQSLLEFDDSGTFVQTGLQSYLFCKHTDAVIYYRTNCSLFGFKIPIIGVTVVDAKLHSNSGIAGDTTLSSSDKYEISPIMIDLTNATISSAVNYTFELISIGQCGNFSQNASIQFEEPIRELQLKVKFSRFTGYNLCDMRMHSLLYNSARYHFIVCMIMLHSNIGLFHLISVHRG